MRTNPHIPIPLHDRAGGKVYLINLSPPQKGIAYVEETYGGRTVFIYTNYDANSCVDNAAHVLARCPSEYCRIEPGISFSGPEAG